MGRISVDVNKERSLVHRVITTFFHRLFLDFYQSLCSHPDLINVYYYLYSDVRAQPAQQPARETQVEILPERIRNIGSDTFDILIKIDRSALLETSTISIEAGKPNPTVILMFRYVSIILLLNPILKSSI